MTLCDSRSTMHNLQPNTKIRKKTAIENETEKFKTETNTNLYPYACPPYSHNQTPTTPGSLLTESSRRQWTDPREWASATSHILGVPYADVAQIYSLGALAGVGQTGEVRVCQTRSTGELVACKTLRKRAMRCQHDVTRVRTEISALRVAAGHPGVVRLRGAVEDGENVYIFTEFCEGGGDLFDRIQQKTQFCEEDAARICRMLLSVLCFIHDRGIMHRDLKPENILMARTDSDTDVKVIDFGQASFFKPGEKLTHPVGTEYYIAPEVLDCYYGPEADVWSIGCILYVLLSGAPPFWSDCPQGIFAEIKNGFLDVEGGPWQEISHEARDLVRRMLCRDPSKRITPQQARVHPWIVNQCRCRVSLPPFEGRESEEPYCSSTGSDRLSHKFSPIFTGNSPRISTPSQSSREYLPTAGTSQASTPTSVPPASESPSDPHGFHFAFSSPRTPQY